MKGWIFVTALFVTAVFLTGIFFASRAEDVAAPLFAEVSDDVPKNAVTYCFDEEIDEEDAMRSLGFVEKEQVTSFAEPFSECRLDEPLSSEEMGRLLYLIVAFFEAPVPVRGRLEKVGFASELDRLVVCAEVSVILDQVKKTAHAGFLPDSARLMRASAQAPILWSIDTHRGTLQPSGWIILYDPSALRSNGNSSASFIDSRHSTSTSAGSHAPPPLFSVSSMNSSTESPGPTGTLSAWISGELPDPLATSATEQPAATAASAARHPANPPPITRTSTTISSPTTCL